MGYNFDMYGEFKFNKEIPQQYKEILLKMNENEQMGKEWYREKFKNDNICAVWCPWKYNEEGNYLEPIDYVDECNHNYWFIDWLAWIIESICIPAGLTLNGEGNWAQDTGHLSITDNKITTQGVFYGSNDYKKTIRRLNKILKESKN